MYFINKEKKAMNVRNVFSDAVRHASDLVQIELKVFSDKHIRYGMIMLYNVYILFAFHSYVYHEDKKNYTPVFSN